MKREYLVQNPHETEIGTQATVNGKTMAVSAKGFECELTSSDPMQGAVKLRFVGDEVEAAKSLFKQDAKIYVTFSA